MAIVWPCTLSVDEYAACGRAVEVPRSDCVTCSAPMGSWSGYWRHVRQGGRCTKIWVKRVRCNACRVTHVLLPAFCLAGRLDTSEVIGAALRAVTDGPSGVRPAAETAGVPHTTARGWVRRLRTRADELCVAFLALVADLGGAAPAPAHEPAQRALSAAIAAWAAACSFPGWAAIGQWRFASCVSGGSLLATNTNSPWLIVGRRRFMPPVP